MRYDYNDICGDDCKFRFRLIAFLRERKLLEPQIEKFAKLMAAMDNDCHKMKPEVFRELLGSVVNDPEKVAFVSETYEKFYKDFVNQSAD